MISGFSSHNVRLIALVLGFSWCLASQEYVPGENEHVVPDQLLVGLRPGADIRQILASLAPQAVSGLVSGHRNTYLLRLPVGIQALVSERLAAHPLVQYVEPNRIRHSTVLPPTDPMINEQWALATVQAVQAWSYFPDHYLTVANAGTSRVKVAILDSGADCTHPDFMNAGGTSTDSAAGGQLVWSSSQALVPTIVPSPLCPWQDDNGHGTHTSGTIVAATDNAVGIASLGYPLQLIVYKVLDATGAGWDSTIATAIYDAVNAGAQVISMSLAGSGYSHCLQSAIDYAWEKNVLVVAAAGDTGDSTLQYPGAANHVLGVAATDTTNSPASFSTYGNGVKVAGPGVDILSTLPTYSTPIGSANYGYLSGTSMAAPHVAALGGLLFMLYPNLSVADIAQRIQQTARTPNSGWDQHIGYGVVNAGAAMGGTAPTATQGSLVGQVVDSFDNPVTGAVVAVGSQSFTTIVDPSTGDNNGLFRLANLTPGTYLVTVTATGFPTVNMQAVVVAGADTMLTIPLGASLGEFTGVVTHNGVGVAGAVVAATSGGLTQGTAVTNASGTYAMYPAAGTYTLGASAPNYIVAASGSQTVAIGQTVTVNLPLSAMGNLIGAVTDVNGLGVAGAQIDFASSGFSGGAAAGANGSYSTFGIPAGTYTVTASASGYNSLTLNGVNVTANTSTVANLQFSRGVSLTSGLVGYWPFDEDAGIVAYDQSGNGYNAALSNTSWTAGKFNSALSFNGSNSVGVTPAIPFTNAFSVSAWVNPAVTGQPSYARIAETQETNGFSLGTDTTGTKYKVIVNSGIGSTGTCGSAYGCVEGGTVTSGWHLVTGTYDGTTAILYVDGVSVASDTASALTSTSLPLFMGRAFASALVWNGALDDLRLYSRALTASEVSSLFRQTGAQNLSLTNTADAAAVAAGAAIGFTLAVSNTGTATATSVALSDPLPAGTGVSWSVSPAYSGPGTCSIASQTLTCNFGNLAPGATATVHVTSATSTSTHAAYVNTASASAGNIGTVQASATTMLLSPSLNLTKTADAAAVAAGTAIGYTLAVSNTGTGTATSVTLSDPLPAGTGVSWSISPAFSGPGTCSIASQTLTCNFGNLAPDATATVHMTSATSTSSCASYTNTASANASNSGTVQASATTAVVCPPSGYLYSREIIIPHANVPNTDQINFPILIAGAYPYLATVANGGQVENANGYDIIFTADAAGTSLLVWETEKYVPTNGTVAFLVRVPVLSHSTDTHFYMFYGRSSVTTFQSVVGAVWDSNYKGVWHLDETALGNGATLHDSTSNVNNAIVTYGSGTPYASVAGEIANAIRTGSAGNGNTAVLSAPIDLSTSSWTYSLWLYYQTSDAWASDQIPVGTGSTYVLDWEFSSAVLSVRDANGASGMISTPMSTGNWYKYDITFNLSSGVVTVYQNGSSLGTINLTAGAKFNTFFNVFPGGTLGIQANVDEYRISNTVRSADWIAAEYRNQSSPAGFYSIGSAIGEAGANDCAVSGDQVTSVVDVQRIINEALGIIPAVNDLNHDGVVNIVDVQIVINSALGLGCPY